MLTSTSNALPTNTAKLEGVLLLDKPSGCTSHDIVDHVRRKLKMKAVGHAGTLDPMATGLLILLIGKATKISQYLINLDKAYEGEFKLGETTDTHDKEGVVLTTTPVPDLSQEAVQEVFNQFIGDQYQTPPMFSAKKLQGTPLYKLARKGVTVERPSRFICISNFDMMQFDLPHVTFKVMCSKGTYIRTLVHDVGNKLECGAHLTVLRRTQIGSFSLEQAMTLDAFENSTFSEIKSALIPIHKAVPKAPFGAL